MIRLRAFMLLAAFGLASAQADAQPAGSAPKPPAAKTPVKAPPAAKPKGPSGASKAPPAPSGSAAPSAAAPQAMPAGHPPTGAGAGTGNASPPRDRVAPAADLPAGVLETVILDAQRQPIANRVVELQIKYSTIASGEKRERRQAKTGDAGKVQFKGLKSETSYSYTVVVKEGPAEYAPHAFPMPRETGQRVVLHVYPVTSNIKEARVYTIATLFVEPKDDVFQFDVSFTFVSMGPKTWVPSNTIIELPEGWKGFSTQPGMSNIRVEKRDAGVELLGTISPGQHDVAYRFQVPNPHDEQVSFDIPLPPHVAEMRVLAEKAKNLQLNVNGFDAAKPTTLRTGRNVLLTQKRLEPGQPPLTRVTVELAGIPVPGPGRRYALALAGLIAAAGLSLRKLNPQTSRRASAREFDEARQVLLAELVAVEKAHERGDIGPKMYTRTRQALLGALSRLIEQADAGEQSARRAR